MGGAGIERAPPIRCTGSCHSHAHSRGCRVARAIASVCVVTDDVETKKPDYEPPAGAETTASWRGTSYMARAGWTVLRKKEKPSAEFFSVSYVVGGRDGGRPVTFVFNGGRGASSASPHVGAVGPQRLWSPADGTLPPLPPQLVENEESWLAFTDLVFVDPIGTGFSRVIDQGGGEKEEEEKKENATDPSEYFGYKRDL